MTIQHMAVFNNTYMVKYLSVALDVGRINSKTGMILHYGFGVK